MNLPSFSGRDALILHRPDRNREALAAQLRRIGLRVSALPPSEHPGRIAADIVFFDADAGHGRLFPWPEGQPPMPLVAILGSEAPGRLEWALAQAATAFMMKPIGSNGAFNALVVAHRIFEDVRALQGTVRELSDRVRARPVVVRAVLEVMRRQAVDESGALDRLRRAAMASRTSVEALCASVAAAPALAAQLPAAPPPVPAIINRTRVP